MRRRHSLAAAPTVALLVAAGAVALLGEGPAARTSSSAASNDGPQRDPGAADVRRTVEDFLDRLGSQQLETLAADFTDTALIIVSRFRDGRFVTSTETASDWLARMRQRGQGRPFREPLANVTVTIEQGTLAHLRADFEIVSDGQAVSSGVDHFTLVREPDGWRIAVVAYTSIPAGSNGPDRAARPAALDKTLVAHRGASAYAPEHTLAAYRLAIEQGADFVEQDLGVTRDGVLVCLHDLGLERTTDVEEVFPDRFTEVTVRGRTRKAWLVKDFTLAEVKRLDAGSWFDPRFAGERVPTWQEAIDLIRGKAGLYPELKSPASYRDRGTDQIALVVETLRRNALDAGDPSTPVILQSFDADAVRALATALPSLPRVLLLGGPDGGEHLTSEGLQEIATFATGIGPSKTLIDGQPEVVRMAHDAGLTVTPYTFRSSSTGRFPSVRAEMDHFLYTLGVDALFTDNPDEFPRR